MLPFSNLAPAQYLGLPITVIVLDLFVPLCHLWVSRILSFSLGWWLWHNFVPGSDHLHFLKSKTSITLQIHLPVLQWYTVGLYVLRHWNNPYWLHNISKAMCCNNMLSGFVHGLDFADLCQVLVPLTASATSVKHGAKTWGPPRGSQEHGTLACKTLFSGNCHYLLGTWEHKWF